MLLLKPFPTSLKGPRETHWINRKDRAIFDNSTWTACHTLIMWVSLSICARKTQIGSLRIMSFRDKNCSQSKRMNCKTTGTALIQKTGIASLSFTNRKIFGMIIRWIAGSLKTAGQTAMEAKIADFSQFRESCSMTILLKRAEVESDKINHNKKDTMTDHRETLQKDSLTSILEQDRKRQSPKSKYIQFKTRAVPKVVWFLELDPIKNFNNSRHHVLIKSMSQWAAWKWKETTTAEVHISLLRKI